MSRIESDSMSGEAPISDLSSLPDASDHLQSPVSQASMQGEIGTMAQDDMVVDTMQHTAEDSQQSQQPLADGALLSMQLDFFPENLMFASGSAFPMTPMSAYGLGGGIPDFYFGNDAPASTMFFNPGPQSINGESSVSPFGFNQPFVDNSNSQTSCMADDEDALIAEYVPHVPGIDESTRNHIINMLDDGLVPRQAGHITEAFPSLRHLDAYVQLYFEHFHQRWPVLHVQTFKMSPETWQLAFSVAYVGCQFSEASQKSKHLSLFQGLSLQVLNKTVRIYLLYDYEASLTAAIE